MQTMIEFRHVRKAYGEKVILKDFSLSVEKGELNKIATRWPVQAVA